jgi:hypothetical protein
VASAKFTNNDSLMGLGDRPGADVTARLLLALTALYVERLSHTQDEQSQYVELALRLIDRVDEMTRITVANILATHAAAPTEVRERLVQLGSDPALGDAAAGAPARGTVTDGDVAWIDAANETPTAEVIRVDARIVASPRPALPFAALGEAFFAATAAERRNLLTAIAADGAAAPVAATTDGDRDFFSLDAAALEGKIGQFIREFERVLAIPRSLSERIVNDVAGEPFVVAAKSVNMPIAVLQRILLLVNPAVSHSVQRVYDLTDLYHALDRGAAIKLMSLWRAEAKPDEAKADKAKPDETTTRATPDTRPDALARPPSAAHSTPTLGLRSRFGALSDRLHHGEVKPRPGQGSIARRDLRSR